MGRGRSEAAVRPKELLLLSLGSCTGSDVVAILKKKKIKFTNFELHLDAEEAKEHPRVFTKIQIEYTTGTTIAIIQGQTKWDIGSLYLTNKNIWFVNREKQRSQVPLNNIINISEITSNSVKSCNEEIVSLIQQLDVLMYLSYLENLTSFGPRVTGTTACDDAGRYIYNEFKDLDLDVILVKKGRNFGIILGYNQEKLFMVMH